MAEYVEIEGKKYEISGHSDAGVPIIKAQATTIHHADDNGNPLFDADGNPVRSVHVSVSPVAEPITEETN